MFSKIEQAIEAIKSESALLHKIWLGVIMVKN